MASDLTQFGLTEMLRCSREVHRAASGAPTMESCARKICRTLYNELRGPDGERACALVRCYKTHRFDGLPPELRAFARRASAEARLPARTMKCLTLLGSAGSEPQWNARTSSKGHQAIPLPSPRIVERAPMIAKLIEDFGLELSDVISPTPEVVKNLEGKTYGVFHVETALGSPSIPAQAEFVSRYGIQSVVGFGGSLASGDLFAIILFSRVTVSASAADRFRTLALDVKTLFFPYGDALIFDTVVPPDNESPDIGLRA
jgi:hypothetical protein